MFPSLCLCQDGGIRGVDAESRETLLRHLAGTGYMWCELHARGAGAFAMYKIRCRFVVMVDWCGEVCCCFMAGVFVTLWGMFVTLCCSRGTARHITCCSTPSDKMISSWWAWSAMLALTSTSWFKSTNTSGYATTQLIVWPYIQIHTYVKDEM